MKKALLYLTLTLAAVVAFVPPVQTQILNALTAAQLQARAWTFTALQTFSGPSVAARIWLKNSLSAGGGSAGSPALVLTNSPDAGSQQYSLTVESDDAFSLRNTAGTPMFTLDQAGLGSFNGGATASGGGTGGALTVAAGSAVGFEGQSGNTYLKRETTTSSLESTLDGARGWSVIGGVLQAPDCPADLNTAPPGWCYDAATGEHVIVGGFRSFP